MNDDGAMALELSEGRVNSGDATMADDETVPKLALPNGKEYVTPASVSGSEVDDFYPLRRLPWFDIESLSEDGFVDKYATDDWFAGELPL